MAPDKTFHTLHFRLVEVVGVAVAVALMMFHCYLVAFALA